MKMIKVLLQNERDQHNYGYHETFAPPQVLRSRVCSLSRVSVLNDYQMNRNVCLKTLNSEVANFHTDIQQR